MQFFLFRNFIYDVLTIGDDTLDSKRGIRKKKSKMEMMYRLTLQSILL